MAHWVKLTQYIEERTPIWVNLDEAITIRPAIVGSLITLAVHIGGNPYDLCVWEAPEEILK